MFLGDEPKLIWRHTQFSIFVSQKGTILVYRAENPQHPTASGYLGERNITLIPVLQYACCVDIRHIVVYDKAINNYSEVITVPNTSMNIRMDSDVKRQAQELFAQFGLDMTTAVNMFLRQSIRQQGIPFSLQLDPFYSEINQERLKKAAARMEKTGGTVHDLIEVEDD